MCVLILQLFAADFSYTATRSAQSSHSMSYCAILLDTAIRSFSILHVPSAYTTLPLILTIMPTLHSLICFAFFQTMERVREQGIKKNTVFKNSAYGASHWFPPITYNGVGLVGDSYTGIQECEIHHEWKQISHIPNYREHMILNCCLTLTLCCFLWCPVFL